MYAKVIVKSQWSNTWSFIWGSSNLVIYFGILYISPFNIGTVANQASKLQPQKTTLVGLNRKGIYLKGYC